MFIEIHGSEDILQTIRLLFEDELQTAGYMSGPRVGYMESGWMESYTKGEDIISVQITEESEAGDCALKIESEKEITEIYKLWDTALINFGKKIHQQVLDFAHDRKRVEQGLK